MITSTLFILLADWFGEDIPLGLAYSYCSRRRPITVFGLGLQGNINW